MKKFIIKSMLIIVGMVYAGGQQAAVMSRLGVRGVRSAAVNRYPYGQHSKIHNVSNKQVNNKTVSSAISRVNKKHFVWGALVLGTYWAKHQYLTWKNGRSWLEIFVDEMVGHVDVMVECVDDKVERVGDMVDTMVKLVDKIDTNEKIVNQRASMKITKYESDGGDGSQKSHCTIVTEENVVDEHGRTTYTKQSTTYRE
ncbi:MAG: hypothetical protein WBQ73_04225 [Candidatus Babeliales bacterium]